MTRVADIMTRDVVTVEPENSVATAIRLMRQGELRRLPVVEDGRLLGIVTSGDLRRTTGLSSILRDQSQDNFLWQHIPIANVMTLNPITLAPDAPVAEAARLLIEHKIGGLPILSDGKLVGIITSSNLLQHLIALELSLTDPQPA
jgi:CBS domain-containing protein